MRPRREDLAKRSAVEGKVCARNIATDRGPWITARMHDEKCNASGRFLTHDGACSSCCDCIDCVEPSRDGSLYWMLAIVVDVYFNSIASCVTPLVGFSCTVCMCVVYE